MLLVRVADGARERLTTIEGAPPDGSGRQTVLRDVRGGTWKVSPDGSYVAVASAGQGAPSYHVTLVDLAGPSARRVSEEPAGDVAWSPGGDLLAATVGNRLVIIDPFGSTAPRTVARLRRRHLENPAWSPDGSRVAVTASVQHPYRD